MVMSLRSLRRRLIVEESSDDSDLNLSDAEEGNVPDPADELVDLVSDEEDTDHDEEDSDDEDDEGDDDDEGDAPAAAPAAVPGVDEDIDQDEDIDHDEEDEVWKYEQKLVSTAADMSLLVKPKYLAEFESGYKYADLYGDSFTRVLNVDERMKLIRDAAPNAFQGGTIRDWFASMLNEEWVTPSGVKATPRYIRIQSDTEMFAEIIDEFRNYVWDTDFNYWRSSKDLYVFPWFVHYNIVDKIQMLLHAYRHMLDDVVRMARGMYATADREMMQWVVKLVADRHVDVTLYELAYIVLQCGSHEAIKYMIDVAKVNLVSALEAPNNRPYKLSLDVVKFLVGKIQFPTWFLEHLDTTCVDVFEMVHETKAWDIPITAAAVRRVYFVSEALHRQMLRSLDTVVSPRLYKYMKLEGTSFAHEDDEVHQPINYPPTVYSPTVFSVESEEQRARKRARNTFI